MINNEYINVLMGHINPPISDGIDTLFEVSSTYLARAKEIEIKLLNQEHHDEYREAKKRGIPTPADLVRRKTISYDFNAKSSDYKFSKEFKLKTSSTEILPNYLKNNVDKYSEWFDFEK